MKKISSCTYEVTFNFASQDEILMGIIHQELTSINNHTQIPGYRKGHAPLDTIVKMHGPQVMRQSLEERASMELYKTLPENLLYLEQFLFKLTESSEEKGYNVNLLILAVEEKDLIKPSYEEIVQQWLEFKKNETESIKKTFYLKFFPEAFQKVKIEELKENDDLLLHDGDKLKLVPAKDFLFFQKKEPMPEKMKEIFLDFLRLDSSKISEEYFEASKNLYHQTLSDYSESMNHFLTEAFQKEILSFYLADFIKKNKEIFNLQETPFSSLLEKKSFDSLLMPLVHKILIKDLHLEPPKDNTPIQYITEPLRQKFAVKVIENLASI